MCEVLCHHAQNIEVQFRSYPGVPPGYERDEIITRNIPLLLASKIPSTGEPCYPALQDPVIQERYINAKLEAVVAVLDGEAVVIPDRNRDGSPNFDAICRSCGNMLTDDRGEFYCWLAKRRQEISEERRKKSWEAHKD